MKNITWRAASFWLLFLSCRRKSNWFEGIRNKNHQDDGAKRAFDYIKDMNIIGFNLHKLSGNLQGQWSVKVNGNWRVFFKFENSNTYMSIGRINTIYYPLSQLYFSVV